MNEVKFEKHMATDAILHMESEKYDGEILDTRCYLSGYWHISGSTRDEFAEKLEKLIQEYLI